MSNKDKKTILLVAAILALFFGVLVCAIPALRDLWAIKAPNTIFAILILAVYAGVFAAAYRYLKSAQAEQVAPSAQEAQPQEEPVEDAQPQEEPVQTQPQVFEQEAPVAESVADEQPAQDEELPQDEQPVADELPQEDISAEQTPVAQEAPAEQIEVENNAEGGKVDFSVVTANRKYRYSFEARLALANDLAREAYAAVAGLAGEYKLKCARSQRKERLYVTGKPLAVFFFRGKKLCVAFRLDPAQYADTKYKPVDVSDQKWISSTPSMLRITCKRKIGWACDLLKAVLQAENIPLAKVKKQPQLPPQDTLERLLEKGLVKEIAKK